MPPPSPPRGEAPPEPRPQGRRGRQADQGAVGPEEEAVGRRERDAPLPPAGAAKAGAVPGAAQQQQSRRGDRLEHPQRQQAERDEEAQAEGRQVRPGRGQRRRPRDPPPEAAGPHAPPSRPAAALAPDPAGSGSVGGAGARGGGKQLLLPAASVPAVPAGQREEEGRPRRKRQEEGVGGHARLRGMSLIRESSRARINRGDGGPGAWRRPICPACGHVVHKSCPAGYRGKRRELPSMHTVAPY